ncbi:uncharacterized protein LOC127139251 isoform X2 [Lates calcarifer]|uniref:Uncharacterized protein LOC127139251 isoform X2 n=1 Tax=Lates calcarifer TaxID=8187 RepID=A0AAJ8AZB5_LATCA|nr:uncharacterized protein LOC127139251 isoform X2 [Lates calcarifer]
MKQLLNEFKGLYEERLRWLELDTTVTREELYQKKEDFLRSYVNDLTDQNQVLVQTIEDLQMEADHKFSNLEIKPHTSDCILDDLNQQRTTLEVRHHLRHLRSDMNSITKLIQQTGLMHNLDTATQVVKNSKRLVHLQSEPSCVQQIHKDNMILLRKISASPNCKLLQQERADTHSQLSKLIVREPHKELEEKREGMKREDRN